MVLYLHLRQTHAGRPHERDRPERSVFWLCADPAGRTPLTRFYCEDSEEARQATLRHIEAWAKQAHIRIGNREMWLFERGTDE